VRLFGRDKARLKEEGEAWGRVMGLRAKVGGWWNQFPYVDHTIGAQDHLTQRRLADENRLLMNPTRSQLWHWKPEGGAVAVRISEVPERHCQQWDLPFPFYQTDFFLNQAEARWQAALLEWGCLPGHTVGIAQIAQLHHCYDPAVPPDKQPRPGAAVFAVVENTTRDFTVVFNDFNGFATDRPYGEHTYDLGALLA